MKIYVNNENQIKALRVNDTELDLKEIEVSDDFMKGYCDTYIKSFCYQEILNENGEVIGISVYPYKPLSVMESIQELDSLREKLRSDTESLALDQEFRISLIELKGVL